MLNSKLFKKVHKFVGYLTIFLMAVCMGMFLSTCTGCSDTTSTELVNPNCAVENGDSTVTCGENTYKVY